MNLSGAAPEVCTASVLPVLPPGASAGVACQLLGSFMTFWAAGISAWCCGLGPAAPKQHTASWLPQGLVEGTWGC